MADYLKAFQTSVDLQQAQKKKDYLIIQDFLFKELALLEEKREAAVFLEVPRFVRKNTQEREELRENYQKISEQSNELIKIMKKKNSGLHYQIRSLEVMDKQEKYSNLTRILEEAESIIKIRTQ